MEDITGLTVKQLRIFAQDAMPMPALLAPPNVAAFRERYGWTDITPIESTREVQFDNGTVVDDEGSIHVSTLQLGERRITVTVPGDSNAATRAFNSIQRFIVALEPGLTTEPSPVVLTEETTCALTLPFDWTALLSPALVTLAESAVLHMCTQEEIRPNISGLRFSFLLSYPEVPERLREHGITLANKLVTIEPRVDTPLDRRRYFTYSPTNSDTHMALIRRLEAGLTGAVSKSTPTRKARRTT
jgi:hypothetical protein